MESSFSNQLGSRSINLGPIFIAIAATTWTMDFWARNIVLEFIPPTYLVMYEHIIITVLMLPILIRGFPQLRSFNPKEWGSLIIIGGGASALATVSLSAGYALGFFQYAPVVALTQQLQPVVAIGLAHLLLRESLPNYYYPLSVVAISGVFLMYWPTVSGFSGELVDNVGLLAAFYGLLAAVMWGSGTVFGKYLLVHSPTKVEYPQMASFRFMVGMVALIVYNALFFTSEDFSDLSIFIIPVLPLDAWLGVLFVALVPGLFALVLYYYGLKSTHASVATLFELAFPLSFFIVVPIITQGSIQPIQYAGAAVLIVATTILSYLYAKQSNEMEETDRPPK